MKKNFHWLLVVLALLAGVRPAFSQAALGIAYTNHQAILFWPTNASGTNSLLLSATNLTTPNWLAATDAVPFNFRTNIALAVTNNTLAARFFRLSLIPPTLDNMVLIPAGAFTIGDALDGESDAIPTASVYVSGFYMDVNLVTSNQWAAVYAYAIGQGYGFVDQGAAKAGNHPVISVDWYDCIKWCNARSQQAGLAPVYFSDTNFTLPYTNGESTNVFVNWTNSGYRLPTEAEWEKAARGGLSGQRFPWGLTISWNQANYFGNPGAFSYDLATGTSYDPAYATGSLPYTSPVGSFPANGFGLRDMSGNVIEWCWDWYAASPYPAGSPYLGGTDPHGAGPASGSRVLRGGYWDNYANLARTSNRFFNLPVHANIYFGFRCVRKF